MFVLSEETLVNQQEFYKKYKSGMSFAICSSYEGSKSNMDNSAQIKIYRSKIKLAGYDVLRILGHYAEDNREHESMIVFCPEGGKDEFIRFLLFYRKEV